MSAPAKGGVYQNAEGQWTWQSPGGEVQGESYKSRDAARQAYQEFRKTQQPSPQQSEDAMSEKASEVTTSPIGEKAVKGKAAKKAVKGKAAKKAVKGKAAKGPRGEGAVAQCWAIFDKAPKGAVRKDLLAKCEAAGINPHTARTQYQRWMHRGDK